MTQGDFEHYFNATRDLSASGAKLQEKLARIEKRCQEVTTKYRGGMDADALAEEIIGIINEEAK
jgi:hypothetical protein